VKPENADQRTGVEIVRKAIQAPAREIVDNAGGDGAVAVGKLLEATDDAHGYDAQTEEFGYLYKKGIDDPAKGRSHGASGRGLRRGTVDHNGSRAT